MIGRQPANTNSEMQSPKGWQHSQSPKLGAEGVIASHSSDEKLAHPMATLLEDEVSSLCRSPRDRQVVRSLAIPVAAMIDTYSPLRKNLKTTIRNFHTAIQRLFTLDPEKDYDLDLIKYFVNKWFQLAVGDLDDPSTGHIPVQQPEHLLSHIKRFPRLFPGQLGNQINIMISRCRKKGILEGCFLFSFLLSKRGWPELGEHKLLKAIRDHQEDFSSVPPPLDDDLTHHLQSIVDEIFPKNSAVAFTKFHPSNSASFSSSRKHGGSAGELERKFNISLPSCSEIPNIPANPPGFQLPSQSRFRPILDVIDDSREISFESLCELIKDPSSRKDLFSARFQTLPEPGKFRIISAGDAILYTVLQPLQGHLLDTWKSFYASTMHENWADFLHELVVPEGWMVNSVDYEAATNKLNINATSVVIDRIQSNLGINVEHGLHPEQSTIFYPKNKKSNLISSASPPIADSVIQKNGQLMGHPLSFPILCIINFAAVTFYLREALLSGEISQEEHDYARKNIRINGDDAGFISPAKSVPRFEAIAARLGLKMSLGKTYTSHYFFMINNRPFFFKNGKWTEMGYLNQKLILNHSLKNGESEKSPFEIGKSFNQMFELFPPSQNFLIDCFNHRKKSAPIYGFIPNMFIPSHLGGFGVNTKFCKEKDENGFPEIHSTKKQRIVAALFMEDQISAVLFSQGENTRLPSSRLIRQLGKIRVEPAPARPLNVDENEVEEINLIGEKNFNSWKSRFTAFDPKVDPKPRYLDLSRLKKLHPASLEKIFSFQHQFLFPSLPPCPPSSILHYPGTLKRSFPPVSTSSRQERLLSIKRKALFQSLEETLPRPQNFEELIRRSTSKHIPSISNFHPPLDLDFVNQYSGISFLHLLDSPLRFVDSFDPDLSQEHDEFKRLMGFN